MQFSWTTNGCFFFFGWKLDETWMKLASTCLLLDTYSNTIWFAKQKCIEPMFANSWEHCVILLIFLFIFKRYFLHLSRVHSMWTNAGRVSCLYLCLSVHQLFLWGIYCLRVTVTCFIKLQLTWAAGRRWTHPSAPMFFSTCKCSLGVILQSF